MRVVRDDEIIGAWLEAGRDLGIEVIASVTIPDRAEGRYAPVLVPSFGAPRGMLLFGHWSSDEWDIERDNALVREGFGISYVRWTEYTPRDVRRRPQ